MFDRPEFAPQVGSAILIALIFGALLLAFFITLLPVKMAAAMLRAKRTSFAACAVALFLTMVVQVIGLAVPGYGSLVAFFLNGFAYSIALGTGYLRGLAISLLHAFLTGLMLLLFGLLALETGVLERQPVNFEEPGEVVRVLPHHFTPILPHV